jgi:hypothetical protein
MEKIKYLLGLIGTLLVFTGAGSAAASEVTAEGLDMRCQLEALEQGIYQSPVLDDYVGACIERELPYVQISDDGVVTPKFLRLRCKVEAFSLQIDDEKLHADYVAACMEREEPYFTLRDSAASYAVLLRIKLG